MAETELEKLVVRITGDSTSAVNAIKAVDTQLKDVSIPGFEEAQQELKKLAGSVNELADAQNKLSEGGGMLAELAEIAASIHIARIAFDGLIAGVHHFSDSITGVREMNNELRRGELLTREMVAAQKLLGAQQAASVRNELDPMKQQAMLQDEIRRIEMDRGQHGLPALKARLKEIDTTTEAIGHAINEKTFGLFGMDVTTHGEEIKKLKEEIARLEEQEVDRADKLAEKRVELLNLQTQQNLRAQHFVQHLELQLAALEGSKKAMRELKLLQLGLTEGPAADKALALLDKLEAAQAAKEQKKHDEQVEKNREKSIENINKRLQEQVDTYGMSAKQLEVYRLKQLGANEADIAAAQAKADQLDELKKHDALMRKGESLTKQFGTPEEQRAEKIKELNELLKAGAISEATYQRALAGTKKEKHEIMHADSALIGSEAAYAKMIEYASRTLLVDRPGKTTPSQLMTGPLGRSSSDVAADVEAKKTNELLATISVDIRKQAGKDTLQVQVANLE